MTDVAAAAAAIVDVIAEEEEEEEVEALAAILLLVDLLLFCHPGCKMSRGWLSVGILGMFGSSYSTEQSTNNGFDSERLLAADLCCCRLLPPYLTTGGPPLPLEGSNWGGSGGS